MSDYRRKANNGMNTTEQTAAQWAVDGRVFDVNCVLVPTDGPDQGKHKLADGIHIYNDLNFVEGASISGNTRTYQGSTDASGFFEVDTTTDFPGGAIPVAVLATIVEDTAYSGGFYDDTAGVLRFLFWDVTGEVAPAGIPVYVTIRSA